MIETKPICDPSLYGCDLHIDDCNLDYYSYGDTLVIDVETDEKDNFVGLAFTKDGKRVDYVTNIKNDCIQVFLETGKLIGHNIKSDMKWLINWGVELKSSQMHFDTILASYVHNTTKESHGLKDLAKEILGMEWPTYKEMVGKGKTKQTLDKQPVERVAAYCGLDCLATFRLYEHFKKTLTKQETKYLEEIELPTARALLDMELRGVQVDVKYLQSLDATFGLQLNQLEESLQNQWKNYFQTTEEFNVNSNRQVAMLLDEQGADLPRTPKGNLKVDKATLEQWKHLPAVPLLLEYSKIEKLKSTYTESLLEKQRNNRIYCSFNQLSKDSKGNTFGISTGRLSSSNPNLQNIPTRTEEGALLRKAFIAGEGKTFIDADYCVAPETFVLKSDLTWCRADQIKQDDNLIGFDETAGKTQRFQPSKVEYIRKRQTKRIRIDTEDNHLVCSEEHNVLVVRPQYKHNPKSNKRVWVKAKDVLPGDKIVWFYNTWEVENSNEAGWLAGVLDGEGWVYQGVGIGQNDGLVWNKACSLFTKYGYTFKNHKNKSGCNNVRVANPRAGMSLLGRFRPIRLLEKAHKLWSGLRTFNSFSKTTTVVTKVGNIEYGEVISIQTSTKTLITNGMFSHNCQIEPRLVAHFTKDKTFIEAYRNDRDIYAELVEGTGRSRQDGKTFMLALLYGAQPKKLSSVFKCSEKEAEKIIQKIMAKLPGVTAWINRVKYQAHQKGGVTTLFGRWIPLPNINSKDRYERMHWERVAVNSIIQGSASEINKKAIIKLAQNDYPIVLNVHDEMLLEDEGANREEQESHASAIKYIMENAVKLEVPIKVDVGIGKDWGSAKQ